MIESIRVQNFRSFVDSGEIEIKPLTIFVGRNGSGKSSILRVLPLLKQSAAVEKKEPLLWFGGVDFGSLAVTRSRFRSKGELGFEFSISGMARSDRELIVTEFGQGFYLRTPSGSTSLFIDDKVVVRLGQQLSDAGTSGVHINQLICKIASDKLVLDVLEDGAISKVSFNGIILEVTGSTLVVVERRGFFPGFIESQQNPDVAGTAFDVRTAPFSGSLLKALEGLFHHRVMPETKKKRANALRYGEPEGFRRGLRALFKGSVAKIDALDSKRIEHLRGLALLKSLPEIVRRCSRELSRFCAGIRYIEPVRASAARYYRYQELAVDEIASDGANVPMFLYSLRPDQRSDLEDWLSRSLGFSVIAERSGDGHIQLLIKEPGSSSAVNLSDTGFGYSQILPIALQIWKASYSDKTGKRPGVIDVPNTIAIEQPELHLHPQMQALLGDLFSLALDSAQKSSKSLRFVLETHSEHLISRIGELIELGRISAADVAIHIFERQDNSSPTVVKSAQYSESGYLLTPWPMGFFVPDMQESVAVEVTE